MGTSGYFLACTIFRTSFCWHDVHISRISTYIPKILNIHDLVVGHWTLCDGKTNWNHENKCFHVQASLSSHWKSTNNEIMQFSYFYWKSNEKNDLISRWNLPWLRYCVMFLEKCIMAYYSIVVWLWPLYGFSQVNPFVEETGLSLEKKNIVMPIKHHFAKSEWLKINLT